MNGFLYILSPGRDPVITGISHIKTIRWLEYSPDDFNQGVGIEEVAGYLATLNDSGSSFTEIADILETHWRGEEVDWDKFRGKGE